MKNSNSTTIVCPKCSRKSLFTKRRDALSNGIEHTYLRCARCGHKATICYTDAAVREELCKQKALFAAGDTDQAEQNAPKIQDMMTALKTKIEGA